MNAYLWMLFTAAAFGCAAYFACRIGIPTRRSVAAIAAFVVGFGIIGGLYAVKRHEAQLVAKHSTPIDRSSTRAEDRRSGN
mgnify:CR=1 FL=1